MTTVDELEELIETGKEFFLIDVRTPGEVEEGIIPYAVHIPMQEIEENLDRIPKERKVVVYCHSGGRSARVCDFLRKKGYDASNLEGGIRAWKKR